MTVDHSTNPTDLTPDAAPEGVADYDPRRPVFSVPYRQLGDRFIGQETVLEEVRQQLSARRRTNITQPAASDLCGLGKTQTAVEYAYRYRDQYPNGVIWLSADGDLEAQLADLAVKAGWIAPESERRYVLEITRHRLRSVADCLIVFDNVQDPAALRDYLPEPATTTQILITSHTGQPQFTAVVIDRLDPAAALRLLIQTAGRAPDGDAELTAAREIARTLDGLPLALELAGAQLAHGAMRFQDSLQRLRQDSGHGAVLDCVLRIGMEGCAKQPLLPAVLDVLAWSAPAPMGRDLLVAMVGAADGAELTAALELGTQLAILRPVPGTDRYALHRRVAQSRREQAPIADRPDWAAQQCARIIAWFSPLLDDPQQLPRFEAELDHLREWHKHAVQCAPTLATRLSWLGIYVPLQRGQPEEVRRLLEQGLAEHKQHGCDDQALLACLHHDLAFALDALGESKRAQQEVQQALTLRRGLYGDEHPDTARSLANCAHYADMLGDPLRALELTEQSLAIRRALHGERHPDTAVSLSNIATYTYNLGNQQHALDMASQALAIHRDLYGDNHPATAASLASVAYFTNALGEPQRALELAGEALTIHRSLFGDRHPDTAISLNTMATYLSAQGEQQHALDLAQQGLAIYHELFGLRHPATARGLQTTAGYLLKLGKTNEAYSQAQAAYDLFRQLLGAKHPQTLNAAQLLSRIKRPGFRIPSFKKGGTAKKAKPRK
ncbi:tetratricopeptide repeat protein [uncultured Thiodictyon sp.]|uniref:tetratricopeptide repeat protein n=1 Tax=uncultured Thiodictyon sp. TaxID=1846217 RepID=UPI0025EDBA58|nr:tetratricopeptide repeat protein [uncultured Thiodictyon sp.]